MADAAAFMRARGAPDTSAFSCPYLDVHMILHAAWAGAQYGAVVASEVIEQVADAAAFMRALGAPDIRACCCSFLDVRMILHASLGQGRSTTRWWRRR